VRRVVLLGPVHRVPVRGLAIPTDSAFVTPLGQVPIDAQALADVRDLPQVLASDAAHLQEHALEVQLPFLQEVLGDFALVPFAVGAASVEQVAEVLERLWGAAETLIVVSTDMSHYHSYEQARAIDGATIERIARFATDIDHEEACGATPLNGLLSLSRQKNLCLKLLAACNSGDTAGGKDRVVGYSSFGLYEGGEVPLEEAGKVLLRLKINSVPPEAIEFNCIVHGNEMSGQVSVAATPPGPIALMSRLDMTQAMMVPSCSGGYFLIAPSQTDNGRLMAVPVDVFEGLDAATSEGPVEGVTIVRSLTRPLRWENNTAQIEIGEEIQWVNGSGPHGLRITNWNDVRDSIEVIDAHGSSENFRQTGETTSSSSINRVYARLRINSLPAETDTIEYNCVLHGNAMAGTVQIIPATEPPTDASHSVQR